MQGKRTLTISIALVMLLVTTGWAAQVKVSQPIQMTSSSFYERGQSVVFDGADYWMFYGRSATCTDPYSSGDPDVYDYVLYYKKASTVADLATATATQVLVGGSPVTSSYLGETAALYFGGSVWVYATIHDGSNTDLYGYYTGDGGTTWTQVGPVVADMSGGQGHHDAVVFNGEVWVLEGSGDFNTMHSATPTNAGSFSSPLLVKIGLTGGLGHFFVDGTDLYLGLGSAGSYYIFHYNGASWDEIDSVVMSGYYDPMLFKSDGYYVFYGAPYTGGRQWIEGWWNSTIDGTFFDGPMVDVIEGRYGSNVWVDMWPTGFKDDNGDEYLFFTSERDDPTAEGAGNIWCSPFDWAVSWNHYTYIQESVDSSAPGDLIYVAAGTYVEQVTIDKSLYLDGDGEDYTRIEAPAVRTKTVTQGSNTWDYIVGLVPSSGTIQAALRDVTIDAAGHAKTAGTSGLVGVYVTDVNRENWGFKYSTVEGFAPVEYDSWGVRVHGNSRWALNGLTLRDYTRDGIVIDGCWIDVVDCDLTGNPLALNGIQISGGARGAVGRNTVRDHTRSSPWAAVGIYAYQASSYLDIGMPTIPGNGNTLTNCFYGIVLGQTDGIDVVDNDLTESIAFHIGIDDSDNNVISRNTVTSTTVIPDKAIGISNGSTGNMIGGPTSADGNTIDIPTSGGLLYGIYVVGTTGSGSNTIQNNTFTGGTRFVQVDGGNSGTTTVMDNTVSDCSFAGVYLNAGSAVVTGNTLTNTVRPIEFWGANNVTIENNYVDGATFDGINAGAFTGTVTVTENAFLNTTGRSLNNRTTTPIDASENYWGVTAPGLVSNEIDGEAYVDYTPWLGGGTHNSPGFTGDYSTLYVGNSGAQTGSGGRVQEGIDLVSGSTLHVAAGTYAEHVTVNKSIDMRGAQYGVDPTAAGARVTPSAESTIDISGLSPNNPNVAVEIPSGVTDVSLAGFTLVGRPTLYVSDESNVRCWDDNLTIEDNIFDGYMGVLYKGADNLAVRRNRMVVNKNGVVVQPTPATNTTISDNVFTLGSTPAGDESAIYVTNCTGLTIENNVATGFVNSKGIAGSNVNTAVVKKNELTGNKDAVSLWGDTKFVEIVENQLKDSIRYGVNIKGQDIKIKHNEIKNNGDRGINVDKHVIDTERVEVKYNSISGNTNYGLYVNTATVTDSVAASNNWWGDASGPSASKGTGDRISEGVAVYPWVGAPGGENIVCDPDSDLLSLADQLSTVDVDYLGGGGGMMYGYTVKVSWDTTYVSTTPGDVTQGTLLSSVGTTFWNVSATADGELTIACILLGALDGVAGPGEMFSIDFHARVPVAYGVSPVDITIDRIRDKDNATLSGFFADDGEIVVDTVAPSITGAYITNWTLAHTDDYIKDTDHATVDAMVTDAHPSFGLTDIVGDVAGLGGGASDNPTSYGGGVATWNLTSATCDPSDDTVTVTVTATDAHGNETTVSDTIIADNTVPTAVTGFDAAPGNGKCDLTWTSGTDTYLAGVEVRYMFGLGEYPLHDWFSSNWPTVDAAYPWNEGLGYSAYNGTGASHSFIVSDRNIYYFQAFCYDEARNYGYAAETARDLATNYWLGDVSDGWGTWGGDGLVDVQDILKLSGAYGQAPPVGDNAACDVGPTVHPDWHRLGLPKTDNVVEFEDAMVFAMNYGVVTAKVVPFLPEEHNGDVLALTLEERGVAGDVIEVALQLEGNTGEVKGISASVAYDPNQLEFVSATLTEDMSSPLADVFFWSGADNGRVMVDALVLGTGVTIGGSGDVATLTFRTTGDGYTLDIESARIRNADNVELDAKLGDLESGGDTPLVFRLVQNAPNPFNPVTKIAYHVPRESDVTIRVYDVSGRVVRTLVDGVVEPGRHAAVWDGRNDSGETVGSGIYFCTMEAPEFHDSRKMTLLK